MFVCQAETLVNNYGCETPPGFSGAHEDALLESSLMHLRLLDEFLRNAGDEKNDIRASDWVQGWRGQPWLDPRVRARINWQVAHLSALRETRYDWKLCAYGQACCEELDRFFGEVKKSCESDRLVAFGEAPDLASHGQMKFAALLASGTSAT